MKATNKKIVSTIVNLLFKQKNGVEISRRAERFFIDPKDSIEKSDALNEYWDSIEPQKATTEDRILLANLRNKLGLESSNRPKFRIGRIAAAVAAVVVPAIMVIFIVNHNSADQPSYLTIYAPNGQTKHQVLEDGTEVWVNSGSTLTYPEHFSKAERVVECDGEVYFSVAKNPNKAFVVKAKHLDVRVYGTKFNVQSYSDRDNSVVTLDQGSVGVEIAGRESVMLVPGEQLNLENNTKLATIEKITQSSYWGDVKLVCNNLLMTEILNSIQRTFDVKFETPESMEFSKERFSFKVIDSDNIDVVMKLLKDLDGGFDYKVDKSTIVITKKSSI